ncbi:MAG: HAMP domain-containing histidine kinase [Lachnospiraceae bacterium]|nr:HAMP domain-containing histidine kinase [Lachnospiraceae bacterium]
MELKKEKTLRRIFTEFILRVGAEMVAGGLLLVGIFTLGLYFGWILPANFSEQYAKNVMQELEAVDRASDVVENIQDYVNYYLVDESGAVIASNHPNKIGETINPKPKEGLLVGRSGWLQQEFSDGTLYLEYYVRSFYASTYLNRYFLCPAYAMGFFAFLMILLVVIGNVRRLERFFQGELKPLGAAAERISLDNLEVELPPATVSEVARVSDSFLKMKQELSDSLEREWQAQRNRRAQIAALAHDLKTPLTVILGNLDLLAETGVSEDQKQMIDVAIGEVKHSEDYIGILVDMAKNTGEVELMKTSIELASFFDGIESKARLIGEQKKVAIRTDYHFMDTNYLGDRNRVERAILNLLSNAIDYSPEGGTVALHAHAADGIVTVTVEDQGPGFSQEMLHSGVELFKMGESSRSSKKHYGIGLYMAQNTAKLHHGQLLIANRNEGGAQIKLILK